MAPHVDFQVDTSVSPEDILGPGVRWGFYLQGLSFVLNCWYSHPKGEPTFVVPTSVLITNNLLGAASLIFLHRENGNFIDELAGDPSIVVYGLLQSSIVPALFILHGTIGGQNVLAQILIIACQFFATYVLWRGIGFQLPELTATADHALAPAVILSLATLSITFIPILSIIIMALRYRKGARDDLCVWNLANILPGRRSRKALDRIVNYLATITWIGFSAFTEIYYWVRKVSNVELATWSQLQPLGMGIVFLVSAFVLINRRRREKRDKKLGRKSTAKRAKWRNITPDHSPNHSPPRAAVTRTSYANQSAITHPSYANQSAITRTSYANTTCTCICFCGSGQKYITRTSYAGSTCTCVCMCESGRQWEK